MCGGLIRTPHICGIKEDWGIKKDKTQCSGYKGTGETCVLTTQHSWSTVGPCLLAQEKRQSTFPGKTTVVDREKWMVLPSAQMPACCTLSSADVTLLRSTVATSFPCTAKKRGSLLHTSLFPWARSHRPGDHELYGLVLSMIKYFVFPDLLTFVCFFSWGISTSVRVTTF